MKAAIEPPIFSLQEAKGRGPIRDAKGKNAGTGGSKMTRMDQAMKQRRFTISEQSAKDSLSSLKPDASKKDTISGVSREAKFAEARERATKRRSLPN